MFRKPIFATFFATAYLVVYYILFYTGASEDIITMMFAFSPFLVLWMAISILKHGKYTGVELKENEEWGYEDKPMKRKGNDV